MATSPHPLKRERVSPLLLQGRGFRRRVK